MRPTDSEAAACRSGGSRYRSRVRSRLLLSLLVVASLAAGCAEPGSDEGARQSEGALVDIGAGLRGIDGLAGAVYAKGIPNVAVLASGVDGAVFAATAEFEDSGTDAVYLLSGTDEPLAVIEGLHTSLGLLWHDDALYVASKERIDAYEGFDGAKFAGTRTVIQFPADVGELNGLALDGDRLLVGISAPCDNCEPDLEYSAAVVAVGLDGSEPQVYASGIRAPISLAVHPNTSDLFVTMNQRDDLAAETPGDWLGIVKAGQDWGFPDCYGQDTAACADAPKPLAELDPHGAVSGLALLTQQHDGNHAVFGVTGPAALVAEWAKSSVKLVDLSPTTDGSTGTVSDFVTGLQNPVPVLKLNDGSVLVGDWTTGVVYRIAAG